MSMKNTVSNVSLAFIKSQTRTAIERLTLAQLEELSDIIEKAKERAV